MDSSAAVGRGSLGFAITAANIRSDSYIARKIFYPREVVTSDWSLLMDSAAEGCLR